MTGWLRHRGMAAALAAMLTVVCLMAVTLVLVTASLRSANSQIAILRTEQAARDRQIDQLTQQIQDQTAEIARLSALVLRLGGDPDRTP